MQLLYEQLMNAAANSIVLVNFSILEPLEGLKNSWTLEHILLEARGELVDFKEGCLYWKDSLREYDVAAKQATNRHLFRFHAVLRNGKTSIQEQNRMRWRA